MIGKSAKGIFGRQAVLVGAEDDADGRVVPLVVNLSGIVVQVHVQLPCCLRGEFGSLQFYQHIGFQYLVVEDHIHIVVGVVQCHPLLGADKHKSASQLQQKVLNATNKHTLQVAFHNGALDGLRKLKQSTVYLFLFSVFDDYECSVIGKEELAKVLHMLLNYSIRRLICEVNSNSLRGLYKTLYKRVFGKQENKQHYYDAVVSFLSNLTSRDAIPTDDIFALALKEKNLYRKNALCKYLLVAVENQGKEKIDTATLSIEHIMPQNKNLSKSWQNMLGENWEQVHERYLHTLGNLTLTGYNSELGDKPFDLKKKMLENPEKPSHITVLYADVLNKETWDEKEIRDRADRLIKIIFKLFPIVEATKKIDFTDPRYQEYTVVDPSNATFKYVNYYELLQVREDASDEVIKMAYKALVKKYHPDTFDGDTYLVGQPKHD